MKNKKMNGYIYEMYKLAAMFQGKCFHLLLVAVLQFCIQEVQSDRLPEVNDLNTKRIQGKMVEKGKHQSTGIRSTFSFRIRRRKLIRCRKERRVGPTLGRRLGCSST